MCAEPTTRNAVLTAATTSAEPTTTTATATDTAALL